MGHKILPSLEGFSLLAGSYKNTSTFPEFIVWEQTWGCQHRAKAEGMWDRETAGSEW